MIRNATHTVNLFECPSDSSEASYFSDLALPEAKNATKRILAVKLRQPQSLRSITLYHGLVFLRPDGSKPLQPPAQARGPVYVYLFVPAGAG